MALFAYKKMSCTLPANRRDRKAGGSPGLYSELTIAKQRRKEKYDSTKH